MSKLDEQILRTAKEVMVKYIEVGRVSPGTFPENFKKIYKSIHETVYENGSDESSEEEK